MGNLTTLNTPHSSVFGRSSDATLVGQVRHFAPGARNGRRDLHRLLATAAGASLLTTFVGMAAEARLPLLGNVAQHRATLDDHHIMQLNVVPCISVPSEVAAARAQDLWTRTMETAPVLKACDVRWCPNRALSSCETPPPIDPEC